MRALILLCALISVPVTVVGGDLTLRWDPNPELDLSHYNIYTATREGDHTGPWQKEAEVRAPQTTATVTMPDRENRAWYVTASDESGNESGPSNMVELYDRTAPANPANLSKD